VQADLLKDNHESRERYHSNLNELQGRLFEQTKEVTEVVATNTAILTRVEKKL
jgi:ABC-type Zn2+ transport system substrate-binding protein/surface adhesin